MLFPTLDFLLFFLGVAAVMALLAGHREGGKLFLVAASYFFYAQWNWRFCFLLATSSALTYLAGRVIGASNDRRVRRTAVALAVGAHLIILGFFKYFDFFVDSLNSAARLLGLGAEMPFLEVILPVGISFFTFHGISYVVDVYRGDVAVCRRLGDMLLYLSFFPQLVAGPIVRAAYFLPQLYQRTPGPIAVTPAVVLIVTGLFKKVVVANYLATDLVDPVFFDPSSQTSLDLLLGVYGYAVQIYCDFSAYTDMAIGIATLLGYRFPQNFDQPYRAQGFREFWQRWHISLSSWLRDYLYKPLGGSRGGTLFTARNLMITMLLGGIWHGAAWKFVFWGGIHGSALVAERAAGTPLERLRTKRWGRVVATLVVFHVVCLAWIFFRADGFTTAWLYLETLLSFTPGLAQATPFTLLLIAGGLAAQFVPPRWPGALAERLAPLPLWALAVLAGIGIAVVDALGPDGVAPFIYFQF